MLMRTADKMAFSPAFRLPLQKHSSSALLTNTLNLYIANTGITIQHVHHNDRSYLYNAPRYCTHQ